VAVVLHLAPVLRRALYPLVVASQAVPVVVIAPILVIWFGFGMGPKLIVIALICFFPIVVNTLDGLRAVDRDQARMLRTLGAGAGTSSGASSCLGASYLFSGQIAVAVAVIGAVLGAGRLRRKPRARDPDRDHAAAHPRACSRPFCCSRRWRSPCSLVSAIERRAVPWARGSGRQRRLAWRFAVIAVASRRPRAVKSESAETASRPWPRRDARLVPESRPRHDLRAQNQGFRDVGLDVPAGPVRPPAPIKQIAVSHRSRDLVRAGGLPRASRAFPVVAVAALVRRPRRRW
jgi:hypothetical protein